MRAWLMTVVGLFCPRVARRITRTAYCFTLRYAVRRDIFVGPLVGRRDLTSREIKIQGSFSKKKKKSRTKRRPSPFSFFFFNTKFSWNQFQDIGSTVKEMHILPRSAGNLIKIVELPIKCTTCGSRMHGEP